MLFVQANDYSSIEAIELVMDNLNHTYQGMAKTDQENPTIKLSYSKSGNELSARAESIVAEQKAETERQRLAAEAKTQSEERQKIEAEKARIAAERQRMESERLQLERQKQEQELEAQRLAAEKDVAKQAALKPKINAASAYDFTVDDETLVPSAYLSPDEKKIRAAIKDGVREIPGTTITERRVVR